MVSCRNSNSSWKNWNTQTKDEDRSLVHECVTDEEIARIVSRWTGIPVAKLNESERNKTLHLADELHQQSYWTG